MSKHETFHKNILAITGCRSFEAAIRGWTVADRICLSNSDEMAVCELCSTRFRLGAIVNRPHTGAKKLKTIAVGGKCLITLLEKQFSDSQEIVKLRVSLNKQVKERYEGLVDRGSWITWIYENATPNLIKLAVHLKHVGALRKNSDLNKLLSFHDNNRKYPTDAIWPFAAELRSCRINVPKVMTLDQVRTFHEKISPKQRESFFRRQGEDYLDNVGVNDIDHWRQAWQELSPLAKRLVAGLAALSDELHANADDWIKWIARHVKLPKLQFPLSAPRLAWNRVYGLCLVSERAPLPTSMVHVFLWGRNEWQRFQAKSLHAVIAESPELAEALEYQMFWNLPAWCE